MESTYHSPIGGSEAPRFVPCPGSVSLQAMVTEPQSTDPDEGDAAHFVASHIIRTGDVPTAGCQAPNGVIITDKMLRHVDVYLRDIWGVIRDEIIPPENAEYHVPASRIHEFCFGTCDYWYYDQERRILYVWEFKYGWGIIEAFENWQLLTYVIALVDLLTDGSDITLSLRVVQPRPYHPDGPVREWTLQASELPPYVERLRESARQAYEPNPPINTGPHCRHCRARHLCAANYRANLNAIDISMQSFGPEFTDITYEWDMLQRAKDLIAGRLEALEAQTIEAIKGGAIHPDFGVRPGRGKTIWKKSPQEIIAVGDLMGVDLRKPVASLTPTQAIDAGMPEDIVTMFSEHKPGALKLVKEDIQKVREVLYD